MPSQNRTRQIILLIERISAILFGIATLVVFVSAVGRYAFASPIPDAFDISRLVLAVTIAWGFASLGYRGSHIKVDLLTQWLSPAKQRIADLFAWTVLLIFSSLLCWKLGEKALSNFSHGEVTMDLRIPHWPFLSLIVLGLFMAVITTLIRLSRIYRFGEGLDHEAPSLTDEAGVNKHE